MPGDEFERLLDRAREGDAAAWQRFLARAAQRLRAELARQIASDSVLEEVLQECLIALHEKRHTLDPGRPAGPWMRAIARYKLGECRRRNRALGTQSAVGSQHGGAQPAGWQPGPGISGVDALIDRLAAEAAPPHPHKARAFAQPLALAAASALIGLIATLGLPPATTLPLIGKWLFSLPLTLVALLLLWRLGHPGRRARRWLWLAMLPLAMVLVVAGLEVAGPGAAPFPGATWRPCLAAMALIAPLGLVAALIALRRLAPVRPRAGGLAAGLFGAGMAMTLHAPFCPEDGALLVLVFYAVPILAWALAGWIAGPRLLRW